MKNTFSSGKDLFGSSWFTDTYGKEWHISVIFVSYSYPSSSILAHSNNGNFSNYYLHTTNTVLPLTKTYFGMVHFGYFSDKVEKNGLCGPLDLIVDHD